LITALHGISAAFALFLSFAGYGSLLQRIFRDLPRDTGFLAASGMALLCIAGGILNYFSLAGRTICFVIVVVGILAYAVHFLSGWKNKKADAQTTSAVLTSPVAVLLLIFIGLAFVLFFAAAFQLLNGHDDQQAYAVFPVKMLETGSMGIDPFNERRMLSGLGGQSFLHTLFLSVGNLKSLHCLDQVTGRLVFLALLAGHLSRAAVFSPWSLFLLTVALLIPSASVNTSSTMTGLALFYGLFRTLGENSEKPMEKSAFAALLAGALCSLKHTFIPVSLMTVGVVYFLAGREQWKSRMSRLFTCFALCGLFVLPWMLESYRSNGTFLFPLLGRGFHGTVYGISPDVAASLYEMRNFSYVFGKTLELMQSPEFLPSLLLVFFVLIEQPWKHARHSPALLILLAVWVFAFLFAPMSGGFRRYIYPYTCAGLFFFLVERLKITGLQFEFTAARVRTLVLIAVLTACYWSVGVEQVQASYQTISKFRKMDINSFSGMEQTRKVQSAVPEQATILAVHSRPVLLDFARNPIYVVDHAGSSSPPPGLPLFGSAEQIADYLRSYEIRYLIYSYGDEGGFGRSRYSDRLSARGSFYANRLRRLAENSIRFRERIAEMATKHRVIADDGFQLIIDLKKD
jgi:hypothetical protein